MPAHLTILPPSVPTFNISILHIDRLKRLKAHVTHEGRLTKYTVARAAKFDLQALIVTTTVVVIVALTEGCFVGRTKDLGRDENSSSRDLSWGNSSQKGRKRVQPVDR